MSSNLELTFRDSKTLLIVDKTLEQRRASKDYVQRVWSKNIFAKSSSENYCFQIGFKYYETEGEKSFKIEKTFKSIDRPESIFGSSTTLESGVYWRVY